MTKPIFRMSESGRCTKALSAKLLGYESEPVPKWLETAANEGAWHEQRIKSNLMDEEALVYDEQLEILLDYPSFTLIGHIDGKIASTDDTPDLLLEIKSMSQFEFDRWMKNGFKGFPTYASQISCYMEATGLSECLYIVKNRSSGYEDRKVISPPIHMTEIIGHLTDVTNHVLGNQLIERDFDPQSIECRRCEYKHLCVPEPRELTPLEETVLGAAVIEWRQGRQLALEGQEMIDNARKTLEAHTRATNILKWRHLGLAIQLVHYSEQKTYSKSKLLQHFTEEQLEVASQVKEAYDQLRINDLEADNG